MDSRRKLFFSYFSSSSSFIRRLKAENIYFINLLSSSSRSETRLRDRNATRNRREMGWKHQHKKLVVHVDLRQEALWMIEMLLQKEKEKKINYLSKWNFYNSIYSTSCFIRIMNFQTILVSMTASKHMSDEAIIASQTLLFFQLIYRFKES